MAGLVTARRFSSSLELATRHILRMHNGSVFFLATSTKLPCVGGPLQFLAGEREGILPSWKWLVATPKTNFVGQATQEIRDFPACSAEVEVSTLRVTEQNSRLVHTLYAISRTW